MKLSTNEYGAEIVAALMWEPQTYAKLRGVTGAGRESIRRWVNTLRRSGVVRITSWHPVMVEIQPKPFALPDVATRASRINGGERSALSPEAIRVIGSRECTIPECMERFNVSRSTVNRIRSKTRQRA